MFLDDSPLYVNAVSCQSDCKSSQEEEEAVNHSCCLPPPHFLPVARDE